jgi:hypothetical protein
MYEPEAKSTLSEPEPEATDTLEPEAIDLELDMITLESDVIDLESDVIDLTGMMQNSEQTSERSLSTRFS